MSLADHAPDKTHGRMVSARDLAIMAIFIALSAAGSFIKIPSAYGTVALDSAPGYFSAVAFGPWVGVIVIAIGHLLTSAIAGFPFSIPIHLLIAVGMGFCALVFRWFGRKHLGWLIAGVVITTLLNTFGLGLTVLPIGGWGMYVAAVPGLLLGSAINLIIAAAAYFAVRDSRLLR